MKAQRVFTRRLAVALAKTATISACIVAGTVQAASGAPPSTVTVMTRNVYFGADLLPIGIATTPQQVIDAASAIFASVQATNFPERARALADEIAATQPDLVGLQEVALWRTHFPVTVSPTPTAEHVEFDFLELLQQELAARDAHYEAVAVRVDTDVQLPTDAPGQECIFPFGFVPGAVTCRDLRFTDRTVILVRLSPQGPRIHTSNVQVQTFEHNLVLPIPGGAVFASRKGWLSVDVQLRGRTFRFITAHLQPGVDVIQEAQAAEIVAGPADTDLPVIFVCDCNSPADGSGSSTYDNLVAAGFSDAWSQRFPLDPGLTCCQNADLANASSVLSERLDLVLFKGPFAVTDMAIVGDDPADKTPPPSGLWPSDHAGVVGQLRQSNSH